MKNLSLICCFFSFLLLAGQTSPKESALDDNWEQWQDKVPVSGHIRVGFMLDQNETTFNPSEFYVLIPDTNEENLCVELSSKDGRYSANINYDISELKQGVQLFTLPTKYKSELSNYRYDEVVILSSLNKDCDEDESKTYLLSGWLNTERPQSISVYLNLSVPTSLVAVKEDGTEVRYKCETLDFPKVAFSKRCKIPVKETENIENLVVQARVGRGSRTHNMEYEMPVKLIKF